MKGLCFFYTKNGRRFTDGHGFYEQSTRKIYYIWLRDSLNVEVKIHLSKGVFQ